MSNKMVPISDFGAIITGKTPSSNFPEDFGGETLFITPSDDFDHKYIRSTVRNLSSDGTKKLKSKLLPSESVMITCIGSDMGKIAMNAYPAITNQQVNSIIIDKSKYDPSYVYYKLKNSYDILRRYATGSTAIPLLNKTDFSQIEINIDDDLYTQQKIAAVLNTLDAKIELNRRINTQLEAMAKTLYEYWFVQFDFPNEKGKPYKSSGGKMFWNDELKRSIPVGWGKGVLADIGSITGGSTPPREVSDYFDVNGTAWITPKDLSQNLGNKFITKGENGVSEKGIKAASLAVMPKGTILLSSRAPIGYMAIARTEVTTNQGFKSFVPNKGYSIPFIYYTVQNSIPIIINHASGSTFKEASASVLKAISICLPLISITGEFRKTVDAIFGKQNNLELETQTLTELHDWLLPMLMNGQITIN